MKPKFSITTGILLLSGGLASAAVLPSKASPPDTDTRRIEENFPTALPAIPSLAWASLDKHPFPHHKVEPTLVPIPDGILKTAEGTRLISSKTLQTPESKIDILEPRQDHGPSEWSHKALESAQDTRSLIKSARDVDPQLGDAARDSLNVRNCPIGSSVRLCVTPSLPRGTSRPADGQGVVRVTFPGSQEISLSSCPYERRR